MAIAAMVFLMLISVWWNDKRLVLAGFLGLAALVGAVRHQQSFPDNEDTLVKYYGKETEFEAVVIREPDVRSDKINLTVKPVEFNGNILLNIGRYPEYSYGDKLKVSGKVEEPFESEEFSYKDYLARYETYALMRFPKIKKIGQGEAGKTKAALLAVKHQFQSALAQVLPEPHNALAQGLILGAKRAIPEDLKNAMIAVGVSHIIVISGYNMSIITQNILKIRPWAGRRAAMILSFALILAFVIMSGADASVVRAAIMAMLAVIAMNIGRIYVSLNALVFVAALMVFQNPKILAFDIGFQLSFTATAGLIYLGPAFEKWLSRLPNILEFRKNLSATLAAQIFTLPLLIFYFDRLSIVSLLVNILILWTVPYAMFFALVTGLAGLLYLPLAKLLAAALWGILEYQIRVVEFFARAPFAEIAVSLPAAVIFIYYAALLWKLRRRPAQNLLIFSNENAREAKI
ncbi:MAG: hypothetical protein A3C85_01995 [Candidatus Doudnabacteria bacterium RIFCSPHIGHO2_02_FULL_48_21]|uniref:ComEC/Rec2-related protein domain-containing protein n=1 Tax=Candidatus Doudnabacteria bacterium RIFCSPLOWO2_02_FULL_48_13 TaxID=1817845 RepID=A0A1F5Q8N5_9BACT|nr:MAG: hypothetical protein A3K05_02200 [Candidatus Doudnabacteria bacterium RIFCSPHIGHO2_01_48_18]OGE79846.1 MAG: hypothetical protein A2668_03760 [Candidatus Doudnabacteria bacterium RIFCSPHIGHO2_01_FULL_48_180]OGE91385.1 MAG: hypothetical protein A3F44_03750 [Candidatus Doudnabacteria bacterium RIFCSPHIGHO2_12_FULL_47_25]OGE93197.1 MAG: hypothetical protein A3C85_01995 [Candidatus Doudnabacteria bacterium RIFCSPHIGHO2_02_FULL_48_21]OGE96718.1 MAG: hypothetical protein A3A83_02870 [Candidatu